VLTARLGLANRAVWSVLAGAFLLTVWDLVLDPAMAHESLDVQFWVWDETGPYFGMPIKNFIGWSVTGLLFMAVSRCLWKSDVQFNTVWMRLPTAVYAANLVFAMVISASVGLWFPILLAVLLGLVPAALAVIPRWSISPRRLRWAEHG
jgi:putative membrane protein